VLAEMKHRSRSIEKPLGSSRDEHLTAVTRGHDPRRLVNIQPHIFRRRDQRLARMNAHAHTDSQLLRPIRSSKSLLRITRRGHSIGGPPEGDEKGVPLVVDLVAVMPRNASRSSRL
jgi:hypothetical protein